MSKTWYEKAVSILQLISLPILFIVGIFSFVSPYLTDFWKGFTLGALAVFFPMLIFNVYNARNQKEDDLPSPPKVSSKQQQATTTIQAKESTDFTLNDTAWVILSSIQGGVADSISTENITKRTGLDRTLVFHTCVMLADHGYLKFTSVSGDMGLVRITATGLQAIRDAQKFAPETKTEHNTDELIDALDMLRARWEDYRKIKEPSSTQKLDLKFSVKSIAKRLDELDSKYADTWTLPLREQVQVICSQLKEFGESRQFFLIERFQETCEVGEALSSALKRGASQ